MAGNPDLFHLDGRVVFVSGAAGHLGSAMVRGFLAHGAHVILNGRDADRLKAFASQLAGEGYRATSLAPFDVTDTVKARQAFAAIPRLDVLVNNAITVRMGTVESATLDDFSGAYDSAVRAAFDLMRLAKPALLHGVREQGHASIINIASMYGLVAPDPQLYGSTGLDSPPHYGPAKAALLQLTRHMACQWGREGIRVNAIAPGPFPRERIREERPEFVARLAARTALGRTGGAAEIAGAAVFLASDASTYVTGAVIPADGGWTAW